MNGQLDNQTSTSKNSGIAICSVRLLSSIQATIIVTFLEDLYIMVNNVHMWLGRNRNKLPFSTNDWTNLGHVFFYLQWKWWCKWCRPLMKWKLHNGAGFTLVSLIIKIKNATYDGADESDKLSPRKLLNMIWYMCNSTQKNIQNDKCI